MRFYKTIYILLFQKKCNLTEANLSIDMTRNEFIKVHTEAIMALKTADTKKKELSVLLFQYLLSFQAQEVKFHVNHVGHYTGLEVAFLNQPHETFKNPTYAAPLMNMFGLRDILIDENKYQSLLESALILLMNADLNFYPKKYLRYTIVSSITISDKEEEFFASEFGAFLSDNFWKELEASR